MLLEMQYEEHLILEGEVTEEDASFSHEFGIERESRLEIQDFKVRTFIDGNDYEITKSLSKETIALLKLAFFRFAIRDYEVSA